MNANLENPQGFDEVCQEQEYFRRGSLYYLVRPMIMVPLIRADICDLHKISDSILENGWQHARQMFPTNIDEEQTVFDNSKTLLFIGSISYKKTKCRHLVFYCGTSSSFLLLKREAHQPASSLQYIIKPLEQNPNLL